MSSAPTEAYLEQLARALRWRLVLPGRIVAEARDHLAEARRAALDRGFSVEQAELEAIERFGSVETIAARCARERYGTLDRLLAASSLLTLCATAFLSLSLAVLRPPRADIASWTSTAILLGALSLATVWGLAAGASGPGFRLALAAAGALLGGLGLRWVHQTLTGPHFEGYALLLGSMVALQGVLMVARVLRPGSMRAAPR